MDLTEEIIQASLSSRMNTSSGFAQAPIRRTALITRCRVHHRCRAREFAKYAKERWA